MTNSKESAHELQSLLDSGKDLEHPYQELLEVRSELIPMLELRNHGVQWDAVISQFEIRRDCVADITFITKSTDTWRAVFIELERPGKSLFIESRTYPQFHKDTRDAIAQIDTWKAALKGATTTVRSLFWTNFKARRASS